MRHRTGTFVTSTTLERQHADTTVLVLEHDPKPTIKIDAAYMQYIQQWGFAPIVSTDRIIRTLASLQHGATCDVIGKDESVKAHKRLQKNRKHSIKMAHWNNRTYYPNPGTTNRPAIHKSFGELVKETQEQKAAFLKRRPSV